MKKEIYSDGDTWYEDEEYENKISDGTYKIYFTGVRDGDVQIFNKNAKIWGYIDDEYYDFTEFVNKLTELGVTTLVDRMAEKNYWFAHGGYGYGYIKLTDEELKLLENTDYANYIDDNKLSLYDVVEPFEYIKNGEYNAIVEDGIIYIDKNHYIFQNWDSSRIHVYYNNDYTKFMKDFIYKVDDSDKITTKTEYDSIDDFFSEPITNNVKLDTLIICTVDTKESLIKLQKVKAKDKIEFKFIVDITNEDDDNFMFKSTIKSQEQLNELIQQTIDMLNQSPKFIKYANDLENCL